MRPPEADRAVFRGLADILAAYAAVPIVLPLQYALTEAFAKRPTCDVLLEIIRLFSSSGRIMDAPEAAGQPCVCAVRRGMTGVFPVAVLANVTDCGIECTRITVRTAAYAMPIPGYAKRAADEFLLQILKAVGI